MQITYVAEEAATLPYDSPLLRVHSLGSDEGSMTLHELTVLCTTLSKKVESLESNLKQTKLTYGAAFIKLIMKVKRLEKEVELNKARRRAKIVVFDDEDAEKDTSKQGRNVARVHTYSRRIRTVSTGSGGFSTPEESVSTAGASMLVSTTGIYQGSIPSPSASKDKEGGYSIKQLKLLSFEQVKEIFEATVRRVQSFMPMDSKLEVQRLKRAGQEVFEETAKRLMIEEASGSGEEQSVKKENGLSKEELQKLMMIVPVEEVYVEALQVKYPIIDWEVYIEDSRKYWKIIRVGDQIEAYQTFDDMLKKFDRDDLDKLWSLVKERFISTNPTNDKERILWVELKRSLDPLYGDYIELNDLNVPLELRRDQIDDLMPTIEEGEVIDEPMIHIIKTRNNESFDEYLSFCDFDQKIHIDCAYNLRFACMIVENMNGYQDQDMGDIILGEPLCKASCVEAKRFDRLIAIHNGSAKWNLASVPKAQEFLHGGLELRTQIYPRCEDGRMAHMQAHKHAWME
ncbi:hypothetical protein Tco_0983761 [Tanacetum coccineum]